MPNPRNRKELEEIIVRYLAGSASPEETRFVESYFTFVENKAAKENLGSDDLSDLTDLAETKTRLMERIQSGILEQESKPVSAPIVVLHSNRRRFLQLAAAAILIGISFGTYLLIKNQKTSEPDITLAPMKTDVAPGGNKAVLTLSNGAQIILDSAHNGLLAKQSGSSIIKTDSGKLTYNITEKPNNNSNPSEIVFNTLSTPRGGQFQLTLPDGTKVWLNAASSITYPTAFAGKERNVTVTGEAYFEVVHNSKMPFHVKVQDQVIEDIGTSFNIKAYSEENETKTTLLEGSVKIIKSGKEKTLQPGEQGRVNNNVNEILIIKDVNLKAVIAWKNGEMSLTNSSVQQIMQEISRWYDVDIKYAGSIPVKKFFGSIDRNVPLSLVLEGLKSYGVETKLEGKTIIVQ